MGYEESREKKKKALIILLVIMLFVICAAGVVYLVWNWYNNYMAQNIYAGLSQQYVSQVEEQEDDTPQLADNPIDFDALKKINPDVYAWIQMPNTVIDYPILQNAQDDYYLRRSIYKKYLLAGCIFTNDCNAKDFSDPVTLVYGHNMRDDTMFYMLHNFEDKKFFDENEYFYIYTPGHKSTYRIVSALKYDNRRITTVYDFTQESEILSYQYSIMNPKFELFNARDDITLDKDSKIVTLSTCFANQPQYRYLVNGVLISDELTK